MKGLKIFFNGEEIDVSSDFGVSLMEGTECGQFGGYR